MKSVLKLSVLFIMLFQSQINYAQKNTNQESEVEKVVLNYIENFFENKFEKMNESLHPRLAKRGLNPNGTMSEDFPPNKLKT